MQNKGNSKTKGTNETILYLEKTYVTKSCEWLKNGKIEISDSERADCEKLKGTYEVKNLT